MGPETKMRNFRLLGRRNLCHPAIILNWGAADWSNLSPRSTVCHPTIILHVQYSPVSSQGSQHNRVCYMTIIVAGVVCCLTGSKLFLGCVLESSSYHHPNCH